MKEGHMNSREGVKRLKERMVPILERLGLAAILAALALFLFFKIAHEVSEPDTRHLDTAVSHFFQVRQTPMFHTTAELFSWVMGPIGIPATVTLSILWFWRRRRTRPDGVTMLVAVLGGWGLMDGLKALFPRTRPDASFANLGSSFPSGHAFFAVTIYGMLAYWLTRDVPPRQRRVTWAIACVMIVLVGFSRVFLGAHYPSDVAAGFVIGLPWLWGCLALPLAFRKSTTNK